MTATYEITGPHVTRGVSWWYVWEREPGRIAQTVSSHVSEREAERAKLDYEHNGVT